MIRTRLENALAAIWYRRTRPPFGLQLLAHLFGRLVALRRAGYARGFFRRRRVAAPVVVIGNITVGGSGKTPLAIWLANALQERGWRIGLVTRGYGGRAKKWPQEVTPASDATEVGDEAVLLARATHCAVVAGPDRVAAAERIADEVDIILADDGLQHYPLARDFEIVAIDGARGLGNGWLLPAGPLREPVARLDTVDAVVVKGESRQLPMPGALAMELETGPAVSLASGQRRPLSSFRGVGVHAVAGIGNPEQFFAALRAEGVDVIPHPLSDHAEVTTALLDFGDGAPVLMTEKDAVKVSAVDKSDLWVVAAHASIPEGQANDLLTRIGGLLRVS